MIRVYIAVAALAIRCRRQRRHEVSTYNARHRAAS